MRHFIEAGLARGLLALVALASVGVLAPPAAGQESGGDGIAPFVGTWRYAGSHEHGTRIIHRAVDHTVEPMNFITRGFAAGRLRDKNQLVRRIDISNPNGNYRVTFDGNRTYTTPPNEWRNHTFDGERVRVLIRRRGDALVQLFRTDSGNRRNVYRITGDGRMRLEVTVQSDQLPRDMRYRLNYRQ
ncbi:MAG TPA: hypothetical protein RMH99_29725 [Sandaracinaceae bacterium LLY-WYZ-13_1]|nr:hypothetical protein [Sandaracinaceae bacterium LLY-WYZ-13_1]